MVEVFPIKKENVSDSILWSIGFTNFGRSTAKNVHYKIRHVYEDKTRLEHVDLLHNSVLRDRVGDIQNGQSIERSLIGIGEDFPDFRIFGREELEINRTDFLMTLLVTGDNFEAFSIDISFFNSESPEFTSLTIGRSLATFREIRARYRT